MIGLIEETPPSVRRKKKGGPLRQITAQIRPGLYSEIRRIGEDIHRGDSEMGWALLELGFAKLNEIRKGPPRRGADESVAAVLSEAELKRKKESEELGHHES